MQVNSVVDRKYLDSICAHLLKGHPLPVYNHGLVQYLQSINDCCPLVLFQVSTVTD